MCQFGKYVHNSYIHKSVFVSCGKCESCLQQKANARAMRIRNHADGRLCLFVTLTYANEFIPYIQTSSLVNLDDVVFKDITVYRDAYVRYYLDRKIVTFNQSIVDTFSSKDFNKYCYDVPELNKKSSCTGIVYWPDVQNFIKRLRINLKRTYNYEKPISYFAVGEYGAKKKSWRPHFHLLLYFSEGTYQELQSVISKSWPFGDMSRKNKRIQIAVDASGYVASYVTKSSGLPKILESSVIRQKHSHSLYFGHSLPAFSLLSLLQKVDQGNLSYTREILRDGVPVLVNLPIPKYVISRYFPKFKGYSSFAPDEIRCILLSPVILWNRLGHSLNGLLPNYLSYSRDEFLAFVKHLSHCVFEYIRITGKTIYDYAFDYCNIWFQRFNFIFKHSYDDVVIFSDFYENINEFIINPSLAPTLPSRFTHFYQQNPCLRNNSTK